MHRTRLTASCTSPSSAPRTQLPSRCIDALRSVTGDAGLITDPERLLVYESDGLVHYRQQPAAVVLPASTEEAAEVVRITAHFDLDVVPRGAGTGLSGGAVPSAGSVVIGTARMTRILEFDAAARSARLQAGVVNAELSALAAPYGLQYAPDPSSQTACTIGGNVAENSGGPHCLKYGVTSRYVTALSFVDAQGRVVELSRDDVPRGLDLVGLVVGSEGCFGLVTEVTVRLVSLPGDRCTLLASFATLEHAGAAVSSLIAAGALPAALEIMDQPIVQAVEDSIFAADYPRDAGAVLIAEFDGPLPVLDEEAARARRLFARHGARDVREARDDRERAALWKGRKKAFGALGRLAPDLVVQDATVPRSQLPKVLAEIQRIARSHGLQVANVFHAGDGNLHPNLLFDRRDRGQLERVERASSDIMRVCVAHGGTITGEHGVGLDKRAYMHLVHSPAELALQHRVRRVFDPDGRWNPGKVLPDLPDAPEPRHLPDPPDDAHRRATASLTSAAERGSGAEGCVHAPADLTFTAATHLTLSEVQSAVAAGGQWWPVDPLVSGDPTLAHLVDWAPDHAFAASYGALRDLVLGMVVRLRDGSRVSLGGRVVKNVAGFDLCRLMIGSQGRLGYVEEVTLRLYGRPQNDVTLVASSDDLLGLAKLADRWAAAVPAAPALELHARPGASSSLLARLLGSSTDVACMRSVLQPLAADLPVAVRELGAEEAARLRSQLRGPTVRPIDLPPAQRRGWFGRSFEALAEVGSAQPAVLLADQGVLQAVDLGLPLAAPDAPLASWHDALVQAFSFSRV